MICFTQNFNYPNLSKNLGTEPKGIPNKMRKNIVLPKNQVMMALPPVEFIDNREDIK